jgi:hypothetical protein
MYILRPFGNLVVIRYIFPRFGILHQEKSGNPGYTHRGGMPSKSLVAIRRLHEDGGLGEALGEDLAADVVEPDALADVLPGLLDHRVPVHVRQEAETKSGRKTRA